MSVNEHTQDAVALALEVARNEEPKGTELWALGVLAARVAELTEKLDEWQTLHEQTWDRLTPTVQRLYMREYRKVAALRASGDTPQGAPHVPVVGSYEEEA